MIVLIGNLVTLTPAATWLTLFNQLGVARVQPD
jgi:hypothetical protein